MAHSPIHYPPFLSRKHSIKHAHAQPHENVICAWQKYLLAVCLIPLMSNFQVTVKWSAHSPVTLHWIFNIEIERMTCNGFCLEFHLDGKLFCGLLLPSNIVVACSGNLWFFFVFMIFTILFIESYAKGGWSLVTRCPYIESPTLQHSFASTNHNCKIHSVFLSHDAVLL